MVRPSPRWNFRWNCSSEVPGTASDWPSDITVAVNGRELGVWTSPGDFGDQRGLYTPDWWKLKGSQYGMLKSWRVTPDGAFVDGVRISTLTSKDLDLSIHHSIWVRIEVKPGRARHPGGVNAFGRGFGNYDQDIVLRLTTVSRERWKGVPAIAPVRSAAPASPNRRAWLALSLEADGLTRPCVEVAFALDDQLTGGSVDIQDR